MAYQIIPGKGAPIKAWVEGVQVEEEAKNQLRNVASLPIIAGHIAVMPDVHWGNGATVGSVIPTKDAIVPAAVGVDIGCGMVAVRTDLKADQLPDSLVSLRTEIEAAVPHGGPGIRGSWKEEGYRRPTDVARSFHDGYKTKPMSERLTAIIEKHPKLSNSISPVEQLGTLGGGNHFIEVCLDEEQRVWIMLHSGSRGVGNLIGRYFIEKAKEHIAQQDIHLVDKELAWLDAKLPIFNDYVEALRWAQDYAALNRKMMLLQVVAAMRKHLPDFNIEEHAINCHHNYVTQEQHFGQDVWITRKGAVNAEKGKLGIIPGSMGTRSYIVEGLGNPDSYNSCSHGAGRRMSRGAAKKEITLEDHQKATEGIECRKDVGVLDESPAAYKPIEAVMAAQADLVLVRHELRQILCVKG